MANIFRTHALKVNTIKKTHQFSLLFRSFWKEFLIPDGACLILNPKSYYRHCGRGVGTGTLWLSRSSARVTRFRSIAKLRSTQPFCFDTKTFSDTSAPIVRHIIHAHSYGLSHISTQMDHSTTISISRS